MRRRTDFVLDYQVNEIQIEISVSVCMSGRLACFVLVTLTPPSGRARSTEDGERTDPVGLARDVTRPARPDGTVAFGSDRVTEAAAPSGRGAFLDSTSIRSS